MCAAKWRTQRFQVAKLQKNCHTTIASHHFLHHTRRRACYSFWALMPKMALLFPACDEK
jgi:hypothetical protein